MYLPYIHTYMSRYRLCYKKILEREHIYVIYSLQMDEERERKTMHNRVAHFLSPFSLFFSRIFDTNVLCEK
jgi:hypothetical protein